MNMPSSVPYRRSLMRLARTRESNGVAVRFQYSNLPSSMPKSVMTPVMCVVRIWECEILLTSAFCKPMVKASTSTVSGTANGVWRLRVAPIRPNSSSSKASSSSGKAYSLRSRWWRAQFTSTAVVAAPAVNVSSAPTAPNTS